MIHLKIEEHGDSGVMFLDDEARAFLGVGIDDILMLDEGRMTIRKASGEIGSSFAYAVSRAGEMQDNTAAS